MIRPAVLAASALLAGCATVPRPEPDTPYRALGTEPFWALELTGGQMVFTEADAPGVRIVETQPRPIYGFAGDIYQGRRINLNIVRGQRCSDGMSDRIFPDRVQVRIDGRAFEGCGGQALMPDRLAGTSWTVESVNARPTGGGERFQLRFEGDRLSGSFGCNRASGGYRFDGQTLKPAALALTRMACPDMRFEEEAAAILSRPAVASWSGDRLTLSNALGTMVLRRMP
jgi:heat shock protein HslJ